MKNFGDNPDLFQAGHSFGRENLQRFCNRLNSMPYMDGDDLSEFIYPALAVEILGVLNVIRESVGREDAAEWFSQFLEFLSECMSNNPMATRIDFVLMPSDQKGKPEETGG